MPKWLFEPIVMFFSLINFPAMFQIIINKLLRDLIITRKLRSFIDNMIVRTESKKRHNKLIEEILKKMEENNLYIKLEKCRWKVREVDF